MKKVLVLLCILSMLVTSCASIQSSNPVPGGGNALYQHTQQSTDSVRSEPPLLQQRSAPSGVQRHHRPHAPPSGISEPPTSSMFYSVESLDREDVLSYINGLLLRVCTENDKLKQRIHDKSVNKLQSSLERTGSHQFSDHHPHIQDEQGHTIIEDTLDYNSDSRTAMDRDGDVLDSSTMIDGGVQPSILTQPSTTEVLENIVERLSSQSLNVKNLTLIIAMVYLDRIAGQLLVYADTGNIVKLYCSCLMIASKLHQNEVNRETLAETMDIPLHVLLDVESSIAETLNDLSVHPRVLSLYVNPLLKVHQSRLTAGEETQARLTYDHEGEQSASSSAPPH
jgi:hypothetical protein